jgi:hypothetical protein
VEHIRAQRCRRCFEVFEDHQALAQHLYRRTGKLDCLAPMFFGARQLTVIGTARVRTNGRRRHRKVWGVAA